MREATALLERARERAELQQDPRALAETLSALAGIYLKEGRADEAARTAQRAIEFADSQGDAVLQAEAQLVLAQVLEAKDDEKGAERNFEEAVRRLRAADAIYPLSDAYAQYSAFLERRGNSKKALDILKQAWQLRERQLVGGLPEREAADVAALDALRSSNDGAKARGTCTPCGPPAAPRGFRARRVRGISKAEGSTLHIGCT
jgi:tetratricopeptide (TPR) repeat protein